MPSGAFDRLADRYDAWFDGEVGRTVFPAEVECTRRLLPADRTGWLEVGVGTGRFAEALGIPEGVDPSRPMLEVARRRGIRVREAAAENLPYDAASFDGVLLVVTLCFLEDAREALSEIARVLRPDGRLLVGVVPADSPWGRFYRRRGEEGHPFYSLARFYSCKEAKQLVVSSGFEFLRARSTLPMAPESDLGNLPVAEGAKEGWGFVAMLFECAETVGR